MTWGYLQPHKAARRGQRAEYVVFPHGCCDLHRTPAEEPAVDAGQARGRGGDLPRPGPRRAQRLVDRRRRTGRSPGRSSPGQRVRCSGHVPAYRVRSTGP
ncbi:hypothetical protein G5V59_26840 [Nocardioides sp. W3-2-3]|uniref:hypothetical protein n=1 Tax=Nocardioides convexus TaxID=2712224 RepID=UPI00241839CD|nr:hypothetical protein [Nocardioides convexus]NHA02010.1 hypothetical protein [Nocardioides convexus]